MEIQLSSISSYGIVGFQVGGNNYRYRYVDAPALNRIERLTYPSKKKEIKQTNHFRALNIAKRYAKEWSKNHGEWREIK